MPATSVRRICRLRPAFSNRDNLSRFHFLRFKPLFEFTPIGGGICTFGQNCDNIDNRKIPCFRCRPRRSALCVLRKVVSLVFGSYSRGIWRLSGCLPRIVDLRRADPFHDVAEVFDFRKRYVNIIFRFHTNPLKVTAFSMFSLPFRRNPIQKCASCIGRNFSYSAFAWALHRHSNVSLARQKRIAM